MRGAPRPGDRSPGPRYPGAGQDRRHTHTPNRWSVTGGPYRFPSLARGAPRGRALDGWCGGRGHTHTPIRSRGVGGAYRFRRLAEGPRRTSRLGVWGWCGDAAPGTRGLPQGPGCRALQVWVCMGDGVGWMPPRSRGSRDPGRRGQRGLETQVVEGRGVWGAGAIHRLSRWVDRGGRRSYLGLSGVLGGQNALIPSYPARET
jgi:hypothetical protein